MDDSRQIDDEAMRRRIEIDELLSSTFNSILRIEERSLNNRLTSGLTINEIHTLVAVGLYESNSMSTVAARLGVTLATLTKVVSRLAEKGFLVRAQAEDDRRKVLLTLTKRGREVVRVHNLFHRRMIDEALSDLTPEEERIFAESILKVKAFFDSQSESPKSV